MKPSFHHKLLNGHFEDPCLFVRILREKRALLFDLGTLDRLKPSDLFKITDVFVTHTHIDHFIGFDVLLRAILRRDTPLNIYGPSNILSCIEGKLRGYTWNLIKDYPTVINVYSYNGKTIRHSLFRAENSFKKESLSPAVSREVLLKESSFKVRAAALDHGIPSLAFSLEEEFHINIDKDLLIRKGLRVGPWLTEFKKILRADRTANTFVDIDGKSFRIRRLADIAKISKGQKISYVTDTAMTEENIARIIELVRDSDTLYCEAYFLEKDRKRALERFHLTAGTAGSIARTAGVKKLVVMHFSPKYSDSPECVIKEAMDEFIR